MSDEVIAAILTILATAIGTFFVWLLKTNTKISNIEMQQTNIIKDMDKQTIPCREHTAEMTELIIKIGQLGSDIKQINGNLTDYKANVDKILLKYETLEKRINDHELEICKLKDSRVTYTKG